MRFLIVLVVLVSTARVHAEPAPTFAVQLRSADGLADKMTFAFANELRAAGKAKTADYRAKGTHADFVAANTDACIVTEPSCAAAIGARLGVDYVFVGMIESRSKRFTLTISVINVTTKKRVRSLRDTVARSTVPRKWARSVYNRMVDAETGELAITCNAPRAVVVIDGEKVAELFENHATLTGLALGTHALELRAPGFKPYSGEVTVDGVTKISVLLDAEP